MREYELKIKDLKGVWHTADLGRDLPAMNYQVNDIAELKDRQADYSQRLKLPLSATNKRIFGYSNVFDVIDLTAYRRLDCRLYLNDVEIAGKGSYLVLDRVSDSFEVQILSGVADLFELLTNRDMSSLDLGEYVIGSSPIPSLYDVSNDNYVVPMATFLKSTPKLLITTPRLPMAYLGNAMRKIASPYELVTDVNADEYAVNVCSLKPSENSFELFNVIFQGNSIVPNAGSHYIEFQLYIGTGNNLAQVFDENGVKGIRWTSPVDGSVVIGMNVTSHANSTNSTLKIENVSAGMVILEIDTTYLRFSQTVDVSKGDVIEATAIKWAESTNYNICNYSFSIRDMVSTVVPLGGKLPISPNLGFGNQFEFFKTFVQVFGLTVFVDNKQNKVYAYTFDKVYENISIAKDWSSKLHNNGSVFLFRLKDYARSNFIRFVENESDGVSEKGNVNVDDDTIGVWRNMFTINFESGKDYPVLFGQGTPWQQMGYDTLQNKSVANIPLWEQTEENLEFSDGKPHLIKITKTARGNGYVYHANSAVLSEIVDEHYAKLKDMLQRAKIIEAEFYLTEKDIEEYRSVKNGVPGCFVPVWIEKFGAYFYINKIKNFISGKLTKVELVKL